MSAFIAEVPILECEIDSHLRKTNHFFKTTGFILDDLDVYKPFATVCRAIMKEAEDLVRPLTDQQVLAMYRKAVADMKELDAALDAENVA